MDATRRLFFNNMTRSCSGFRANIQDRRELSGWAGIVADRVAQPAVVLERTRPPLKDVTHGGYLLDRHGFNHR